MPVRRHFNLRSPVCQVLGLALALTTNVACLERPNDQPQPSPQLAQQCNESGAPAAFQFATYSVQGRVTGDLEHLVPQVPEIRFIDEHTQQIRTASLREGTFSIDLPASDYAVAIDGYPGNYLNGYPQRRTIAEHFHVAADQANVVFEFETITRDIALTRGGQPLPNVDDRGVLEFRSASGEVLQRSLSSVPTGRVRMAFPADGIYTAAWVRRFGGTIDDVEAPTAQSLPYGRIELGTFAVRNLPVPETPLELDLPVDHVEIDFTLQADGEPFPDNGIASDRGFLVIGDAGMLFVEEDGPVSFSMAIVPGSYETSFVSTGFSYNGENIQGAFNVCPDARVVDDQTCHFIRSGPFVRSLSLLEAEPAGQILVSLKSETTGRCVQVQPVEGGTLRLTNITRSRASISLDVDDTGVVSGQSVPLGTYRVEYLNEAQGVNAPLGIQVVDEAFVVDGDGVAIAEWTVPATGIYFGLTKNGTAVEDDALLDGESRGTVSIRHVTSSGAPGDTFELFDLGEIGSVYRGFEIADGTYDFFLSTTVEEGKGNVHALSQSVFPAGRKFLGRRTFSDAGFTSVDLDVEVVTAAFTIEDAPSDNGFVVLAADDGTLLSHAAAATVELQVYPGSYSVFHGQRLSTFGEHLLSPSTYLGTLCVGLPAD